MNIEYVMSADNADDVADIDVVGDDIGADCHDTDVEANDVDTTYINFTVSTAKYTQIDNQKFAIPQWKSTTIQKVTLIMRFDLVNYYKV